ncbi:MAG: outer membrane lipoprotein carrier protein LolA [Proteobacteria bacterium]|nr:outer membrane lipoprotein carrier protein LolA [Pseudomonadota bacterium]
MRSPPRGVRPGERFSAWRRAARFVALWAAVGAAGLVPPAFAPAAAAQSDPEATLRAIDARYAPVRDLRGRFVQTSFIASIGREEVSRGEVVVERPGRIRWSYDAPDGRVILLDGDSVRLYSPEDAQLQIAPLQPGTVSPTALGFLMGETRLAEQFRPQALEGRGVLDGLRLIPRDDSGFESLTLWVDRETRELRESVLVDLFGNRTRLELAELDHDAGTRPEDFEIDVPEGTEIIDLR